MLLEGIDYLTSAMQAPAFSVKAVFNAHGALFFPANRQHAEMKAAGISYEDNYKGDALAAMLSPGRIEVRYHAAFSDRDVARIIERLLAQPQLSRLADFVVTYQGRQLSVAPS